MIVVCKELVNAFGEPVEESAWLTLGRQYIVYYISIDKDGCIMYGIRGDDKPGDWPKLFLEFSKCFDIVSTFVPSIWRPQIFDNGAMSIEPEAWIKSDFLSRFYDQDLEAYDLFLAAHETIVSEENSSREV